MAASDGAAWHERDAFWETFAPSMFDERRRAMAPVEVEQLVALAGVEAGARILDMPCGIGRHAVELARRGCRVTGVDRTRSYLDEAGRAAAEAGVEVELVEADMRTFERAGAFDLAVNLYTSFGYFEDERDNLEVARRFERSLAPGGALVMDLVDKDALIREFEAVGWQDDDGTLVADQREIGSHRRWIRNRAVVTRTPDGRELGLTHRLYNASELGALLIEAGFASMEAYGGLDGRAYDDEALRLVVVARKAGW